MCFVFRCFTFYFVIFVAKFGSNLVINIKNTAFLQEQNLESAVLGDRLWEIWCLTYDLHREIQQFNPA
jgi:hypothetical protein